MHAVFTLSFDIVSYVYVATSGATSVLYFCEQSSQECQLHLEKAILTTQLATI
jgi:hypothetical protein